MDKKTNDNKIEREYVIPLRKRTNIVPRYQRTNKAVKTVKEFLARHMQIRDRDLNKIKVDRYLNEVLWNRGIKHPPSKIKVKAIRQKAEPLASSSKSQTKEGDIVRVYLADMPEKLKFKKLREEKIEGAAKEIAKKKKAEKIAEEKVEENKEESEESKKKKDETEKKEATIEAEQKIERAEAKEMKHTTEVKSPKQEKNQRVGYNQSSRGH